MNTLQHTTELALHVCAAYINSGDVAVDCTCGNGYDTLWLAKHCEKVYAFDIQHEAIESAKSLLKESDLNNVDFIVDSHTKIKSYVKEASVILFNLGFLPGGDKTLTTKTESTIEAVKASLEILKVGGIISITMYPGHEEGRREQDIILEWAKKLNSSTYHCVFADMLNQSDKAPQVLWITKKK